MGKFFLKASSESNFILFSLFWNLNSCFLTYWKRPLMQKKMIKDKWN